MRPEPQPVCTAVVSSAKQQVNSGMKGVGVLVGGEQRLANGSGYGASSTQQPYSTGSGASGIQGGGEVGKCGPE